MQNPNPANLVPGDRVRFIGYGGEVRAYMSNVGNVGEVVRLNRSGFPVVAMNIRSEDRTVTVTDRHGCAWRLGERPPLLNYSY